MGFGIFFLEALRGMDWQLYVPHFAQIVCTMTFRTRQFDMTAHGITIVMCTFCRLLPEFHNLRAQDKPGWGRANSHTNCWNSHVVKVMKFKQARVNGGSNYDSLKVAKYLVI